tara:strand:- start:968 stop:1507 length:540 start_codon:yes stop_codon:yes gene_type:complete
MKLTTENIKEIIQEELEKLLTESRLQKILGLSHIFTAEDLITSMEQWVENNVDKTSRGNYYYDEEEGTRKVFSDGRGIGRLFLNALNNQAIGRKGHDAETFGTEKDGRTDLYQRYVKMKKFIDSAYKFGSGLSDMMRKADPTGEKQKSGMSARSVSPTYSQTVGDTRLSTADILKRQSK